MMPLQHQTKFEVKQNALLPASTQRLPVAPGTPTLISSLFRVLARRKWHIMVLAALLTATAYWGSLQLPRVYESTATVDIDLQAPRGIIGQDSIRGGTVSEADQLIATQVSLIQSDAVLRPVAEKYDLLNKEGQRRKTAEENGYLAAASIELKKLKVKRVPSTYLLGISYRSQDRQLSADVANAVASSYVRYTNDTRTQATNNMAEFMQAQLGELRARMEKSSKSLVKLQSELNLVKPEDKTSIVSARLLQLNTQYTDAQASRMEKEAAYNATTTGSLESAQLSPQGEALKALLVKENAARASLAQIKQVYGERHPEAKKAAAEVAELHAQLITAQDSVRKQSEIDYRQALNREQMLSQAVVESKAEFDRLNGRSFQYERARQEAENDRQLYDDLVRKIRETSINTGFQNSAIRIANIARPGSRPVFPEPLLYSALVLLLSVGLISLAFLILDLMGDTISDPGALAEKFNVRVLGSLPNVRLWKAEPQLILGRDGSDSEASALTPSTQKQDRTGFQYQESIRSLRSSLLLDQSNRRIRTVLITSSVPAEGKSTAAAHLALSYAAQGKSVLLLDCDFRRPSLHRIFDISNTRGLTNVVRSELPWRDTIVKSPQNKYLDLLPAGPPSREACDRIDRLTQLLQEAADEYSLVIVDSPPLLNFAETMELIPAVDGVVLLTRAGVTSRRFLAECFVQLNDLRANILGVVMNGFTAPHAARYYKHYYSQLLQATVESK